MNVWQCTPCGSQLWQLSGHTVICALCGRKPPSLRLEYLPVEPVAQTVEETPA
jgi:hypothetical protein